MAAIPDFKVKFKPASVFTEPSGDMEDITLEEKPSLDHLDTYLIILYSTDSQNNSKENYNIYLSESITSYNAYYERIKLIKEFAEGKMNKGDFTGYYLHGFKVSTLENSTMWPMFKQKKFQVKKKTYLNGPLKDQEFIAKKGKHYD